MHIAFSAMLFAGAVSPAVAQFEENDLANAQLVKVRSGGNRYFYANDKEGCPAIASRCRGKAYVIPGDLMVAYGVKGPFTKVENINARGRSTSGLIETVGLERVATPQLALSAWVGSWSASERHVDIKASKLAGLLLAEGEATWGAGDPERVRNGAVHLGDFAGEIQPTKAGAMLTGHDNSECQVKFRLLGPYLVVHDNLQCGGVSVSFTGTYRK